MTTGNAGISFSKERFRHCLFCYQVIKSLDVHFRSEREVIRTGDFCFHIVVKNAILVHMDTEEKRRTCHVSYRSGGR